MDKTQAIVERLADEDRDVRADALWALGSMGKAGAPHACVGACAVAGRLFDEDNEVLGCK